MWCTALRLIVRADDPSEGYFPTTIRVGRHFTPQDSYVGVRLGVAEGLLSGITTVHDWSHNTVSPQHADAELQALKDIGIRARFSYGTGRATRPTDDGSGRSRPGAETMDRRHAELGACLRTPGRPERAARSRSSCSADSTPSETWFAGDDPLRPKNLIDLMGRTTCSARRCSFIPKA